MRRSTTDRIADLEAKAEKLRAESDRRLSVASDSTCSLMWDAEKALRALAAYCGPDGAAKYGPLADSLSAERVVRWAQIKKLREDAGKE